MAKTPTPTPTPLQLILRDLLILSDSLEIYPWRNLTAVFGDISSWNCNAPRSEYKLLQPSKLSNGDLLEYLAEAYIPVYKPSPSCIPVPKTGKKRISFNKEAWFFINGVATNKEIAKWNGQRLVDLFHRPITVLHNPTDTLPVDLVECVLDRTFDWTTDPVKFSIEPIKNALQEKEKVVVITHSQGSIIMSRVLKQLSEQKDENEICKKDLEKLEIYTFACPADEMSSIKKSCDGLGLKHMEHFANTHDLVAKLGVLRITEHEQFSTGLWGDLIKCVFSETTKIFGDKFFNVDISGKLYIRKHSGHLLNAHYLDEFTTLPYKSDNSADARLYEYLGGSSPKN